MTSLMKRAHLTWDPFRELDEYSHQLARLFGREAMTNMPAADWAPRANITETPETYEIQAELPQVKKEAVKVTFENGVLTLSGERKYEKKEGQGHKTHRVETSYGSFVRAFALPDDADAEKIDAHYDNGMLIVKIARRGAAKPPAPKTISVR